MKGDAGANSVFPFMLWKIVFYEGTTIVARYGKGAYRFGSSFIECVIPYNILDKEKRTNELRHELEQLTLSVRNAELKALKQ